MGGLNIIIDDIQKDALALQGEILHEANQEATQLREEEMKKIEEFKIAWREETEKEIESMLHRGQSTALLQKRKMILEAKGSIIQELIDGALEELCQMDDKDYNPFILSMVKKNALPKPGVIIFSNQDVKRITDSLRQELNQYQLTLSEETREIKGGCILLYEDIEVNCSFEACVEAFRESLQDKVHALLCE